MVLFVAWPVPPVLYEPNPVLLVASTRLPPLGCGRGSVLLTTARAVSIKRLLVAFPRVGGVGRRGMFLLPWATTVVPNQPSPSSGGGDRNWSSSKRPPPSTFRRLSSSSSTYLAESNAACREGRCRARLQYWRVFHCPMPKVLAVGAASPQLSSMLYIFWSGHTYMQAPK